MIALPKPKVQNYPEITKNPRATSKDLQTYGFADASSKFCSESVNSPGGSEAISPETAADTLLGHATIQWSKTHKQVNISKLQYFFPIRIISQWCVTFAAVTDFKVAITFTQVLYNVIKCYFCSWMVMLMHFCLKTGSMILFVYSLQVERTLIQGSASSVYVCGMCCTPYCGREKLPSWPVLELSVWTDEDVEDAAAVWEWFVVLSTVDGAS